MEFVRWVVNKIWYAGKTWPVLVPSREAAVRAILVCNPGHQIAAATAI
jgi:hypothetical protein